VAQRDSLLRLDPVTGRRTVVTNAPHDTAVERFNDGKTDPSGRFYEDWFAGHAGHGGTRYLALSPCSALSCASDGICVPRLTIAVASSREDLHLQDRVHSERTKKPLLWID